MAIKFANNASSTLAGAINAVATTVVLNPGDGVLFPAIGAGEWFMLTLVKLVAGSPVREIVKVTARAVDSLTVVRGQEGTTATTFSAGDKASNNFTAASLDSKADLSGAAFTGPVSFADQLVSGAVHKDCADAYHDALAAITLDYRDGKHQRWAPGTGPQALVISDLPASGAHWEMLIEGVNLGAATITGPSVNWLKTDGTFTTTTNWNTNQGATLKTSGIDFIILWGRDASATIYGKVVR